MLLQGDRIIFKTIPTECVARRDALNRDPNIRWLDTMNQKIGSEYKIVGRFYETKFRNYLGFN